MKLRRFTLPYILWLIVFIVIPLLLVVLYAFTISDNHDILSFKFNLDNLKDSFRHLYIYKFC